jgi:hypothetical protein
MLTLQLLSNEEGNSTISHRLFGDRKREARKRYREFVLKGIAEGRRPDLTGGGLLRSFGGWKALKGFHKAGIRVNGKNGFWVTVTLNSYRKKHKNIVVPIMPPLREKPVYSTLYLFYSEDLSR